MVAAGVAATIADKVNAVGTFALADGNDRDRVDALIVKVASERGRHATQSNLDSMARVAPCERYPTCNRRNSAIVGAIALSF